MYVLYIGTFLSKNMLVIVSTYVRMSVCYVFLSVLHCVYTYISVVLVQGFTFGLSNC